ncbi:DUF2812 domain-containing protein [Sporosarcina oncorhynchi]|uniref:DUF2812 domain-containing protein n=1 Tax=Sporosarcina oncorhynchi TaxID=3056444 RepID=A0ABZ0L2F9_9BACL|nr:DUF2812 domain-containing protein [Sporosarcina sp. T2O-4]WOV86797.1 DUF2812 domain-containing protein [Sporosarcina sp. T2O-4]
MKKMRWFWSYRITETEQWLSKMARNGFHLIEFNPTLRTFTFKEGPSADVTYSIQFDKAEVPERLLHSGWEVVTSSGKWQILQNESEVITYTPMRETLFKRNRLHAYLLLIFSTFILSGMLPFFFIWGISSHVITGKIMLGPMTIPLLIFITLTGLTIFVFRSYRKFEMNEMGAEIDRNSRGRKVRKMRPGWMYQPLQTKEWLEELAAEGLVLESVRAAVFTFRKQNPQLIGYEVNFEPKVNTDFYSFHKETGWQLKFTSNISWLNYSIWAMPYEKGEEIPAFVYDPEEKKRYVKRAFRMNLGLGAFVLLICSQSFYVNTFVVPGPFLEWSYMGVLRIVLGITLIMWLGMLIKIIVGYRREMKLLHV